MNRARLLPPATALVGLALFAMGFWASRQADIELYAAAGGALLLAIALAVWVRPRTATAPEAATQEPKAAAPAATPPDARLRRVEERLARVVRGSRDGYWEWDLTTRRAWYSRRFHRLLGNDRSSGGSSQTLEAFLHPEDLTRLRETARREIAHSKPFDLRVRLKLAGGDYRLFRTRTIVEHDKEGLPIFMSGTIRDLGDEVKMQRLLSAAKRESAGAARSRGALLANVSHEFRTPMNGMIGMTALLADTSLDRQQREYVEMIRSSGQALLGMVDDILDLAKVEAGKLEIDSVEMDPGVCVEEVVAAMVVQASSKDVELVADIAPDVPARVLGDPNRLRQVLYNLIGNAVRYTPRGEVHVRAQCSPDAGGEQVLRFSVRDTGVGLDAAQVGGLFKPFARDDAAERPRGGAGLGLSIAKRLTRLMGGEIGVDSRRGEGATFWFTIRVRAAASAAATPAKSPGRSARVLVVDDNETCREVLGARLKDAGYEPELAASATDALIALDRGVREERPFHAVLTDFRMPGRTGMMLGQSIREDARFEKTRLVLLTLFDDAREQSQLVELGFAGSLRKPVRRRELTAVLDQVLEHKAEEWTQRLRPLVTRASLDDAAAPGRGLCVLLVDDDATSRDVTRLYLDKLGCKVTVAADGEDAVKTADRTPFDLIFMDVEMPVMDGLAATRNLRAREGDGARLPIIALSADTGRTDECLLAGMDEFIAKPVELVRLQAVLERWGSRDGKTSAGASDATAAGDEPPVQAVAG